MKQKGFTLIEVMASIAIFSIVLAGIVPLFKTMMRRNTESEHRMGAIAAAERVLDDLRLQDPTTLPKTGATGPQNITVDEKTYQVITHYCENVAFCAPNNNRHIRIEVAYRGHTYFTTQTVFTQLR